MANKAVVFSGWGSKSDGSFKIFIQNRASYCFSVIAKHEGKLPGSMQFLKVTVINVSLPTLFNKNGGILKTTVNTNENHLHLP